MKIAWITVRQTNDLCSTTTHSLCKLLAAQGHSVTLFSPDKIESHANKPWNHVEMHQSNRRGLRARSVATSAKTWFKKHGKEHAFDVIILDWQLAPPLVKLPGILNAPTLLIDRSPPADYGVFARLQWRVWKKAWRLVRTGRINAGTAVSNKHSAFIQHHQAVSENKIHIIPAGVDLEMFKPVESDVEQEIRLVYHGRLDRHRGVLALPMLCEKARARGIDVRLVLVGEGNAASNLTQLAEERPWMTLTPTMNRAELAKFIASHDVGLLPMPNTKIWSMASPLKRSEYLASGLLVLGVDHEGHQIQGVSGDWFSLFPQETFHDDAIAWLDQLTTNSIEIGKKSARTFAEDNCSWERSVRNLEAAIYSTMSK